VADQYANRRPQIISAYFQQEFRIFGRTANGEFLGQHDTYTLVPEIFLKQLLLAKNFNDRITLLFAIPQSALE